MVFLSLISLLLDINYQITTKYAKVLKSKLFRELNIALDTMVPRAIQKFL